MTAITIPKGFKVTPRQFDELVYANTDVRMELTSQGDLIVMPPTGGTSGRRNVRLTTQLTVWTDRDGTGECFDSQTGFILPNGARRLPDAAWVAKERWNSLTPEQQDGFPPIAPDFVIELVSAECTAAFQPELGSGWVGSPSDLKNQRYEDLQEKMQEYLDNGVQLGWLLEPKTQKVEIYRRGQSVEILQSPKTLSGEDVLPGFVLDLEPIWS